MFDRVVLGWLAAGILLSVGAPVEAEWRVPPPGARLDFKIRLLYRGPLGRATVLSPGQSSHRVAVGPSITENYRTGIVNLLRSDGDFYGRSPRTLRLEGERVFLREDWDRPEVFVGTFRQADVDAAYQRAHDEGRTPEQLIQPRWVTLEGEFPLTLDPGITVEARRSLGISLGIAKDHEGKFLRDFSYEFRVRDRAGTTLVFPASTRLHFRSRTECWSYRDSWVAPARPAAAAPAATAPGFEGLEGRGD